MARGETAKAMTTRLQVIARRRFPGFKLCLWLFPFIHIDVRVQGRYKKGRATSWSLRPRFFNCLLFCRCHILTSNMTSSSVSTGEAHIDPETGLDTTEYTKMIQGEPYAAGDPYLKFLRNQGADKVAAFNAEKVSDRRVEFLRGFVKDGSKPAVKEPKRWITPPFFCEYVSADCAPLVGRLELTLAFRAISRWAMISISVRMR